MGDALKDRSSTDFDRLTAQVVAAHDGLSPQLRKVAHYVLEHPKRVALMTIAELSETIGVPPSGIIRFSKALNYNGFSEIQRILKAQLSGEIPDSYQDRLRAADGADTLGQAARLAETSLARLPAQQDIAAAAKLLHQARLIQVMAARRAFGAAHYLTYMLGGFEAPVRQITGLGSMADMAAATISAQDVLVAISFPDYRHETRDIVAMAHERGAPVVAITDSPLSPIARDAAHLLLCDQSAEAGFRSIVGTIVVAQALALEYGAQSAGKGAGA